MEVGGRSAVYRWGLIHVAEKLPDLQSASGLVPLFP